MSVQTTRTRITRLSFFGTEVAKAGSMEAFEAKYKIDESIIEAWLGGRAWRDLAEFKSDRFRSGVLPSELPDLDHKARVITRAPQQARQGPSQRREAIYNVRPGS